MDEHARLRVVLVFVTSLTRRVTMVPVMRCGPKLRIGSSALLKHCPPLRFPDALKITHATDLHGSVFGMRTGSIRAQREIFTMPDVLNSSQSPVDNLSGGSTCRDAMWFLVGRLAEQESIRQLPIFTSPFLVGRRSSNTLCLPSSAVSSLHAELVDTGESLVLRDLGSTNGTFVNGRRVRDFVELQPDDLVQFASIPFRIARQKASKNLETISEDACDYAMLLVQFDKLMAEESVVPHYQPIVDLRSEAIVGYEVLARSALVGLEGPATMFAAAAQLNLEAKLSQMMRWKAVEQTMTIGNPPHLFLNTHPVELTEPGLIESMRSLRELSTKQPITLEIHEAAVTQVAAMKALRGALRELNVKLAFDDFGAGQARLAELFDVHPDYLKFDMFFVRKIHEASTEKVQMVASLVRMVRDMDIIPLAEGIETPAERQVCTEIGFELAQGYLFGKPTPLSAIS